MTVKVKVDGLDQFRREIKRVDRELGKDLRRIHVKVAELVADKAKAASPDREAQGIKGRGTQKAALVRVSATARNPRVLGVFMGMRRRSGWYANIRYRQSRARQFDPWVGSQWDPGERGGEPYFIGDAINSSVDDVIELYGDEIMDLAARAFPDRV